VLTRIMRAHDQIGMGRVELIISGQPSHDDVMAAIEQLGRTVVTALHTDEKQQPTSAGQTRSAS